MMRGPEERHLGMTDLHLTVTKNGLKQLVPAFCPFCNREGQLNEPETWVDYLCGTSLSIQDKSQHIQSNFCLRYERDLLRAENERLQRAVNAHEAWREARRNGDV